MEKRFTVVVPADKYEQAAKLAKANGISVNGLIRSLIIRATLMPEQFGFVSSEDFTVALTQEMAQMGIQ